MKTEVYSWRVSPDLKTGLEREARRRKMSLSAVLDLAAQDWLKRTDVDQNDDEKQRNLHQAASACFGIFAGDDPRRSEKVRQAVRQRLRRRHGR
jgi:hypothetical protein